MKTIIKKIINLRLLLAVSTISIMLSCNDVLDIKNVTAFDPKSTWADAGLANAYLTGLYKDVMPTGWPSRSALFGGLAVDDRRGVINANTITISSHPWSGSFANSYQDIRRINILVEEIKQGSLDNGVKNTILGQALFLRAYSYFLLVRVYGGVPLLLKAQKLEEDLEVKRASTLETFDAITADLDESMKLLEGQKFAEGDKGRIGEAAVLAFKGRVALYMASPLFNPTDPYNNKYWAKAYTATSDAKTKLESQGFALVKDYESIWSVNNEGNSEAILTIKFTSPTKPNGRGTDPRANRLAIESPVWGFVETYPMKDGFPIGSSPKYNYDVQTFWKNRDPRFDATIVYNAALCELEGVQGRRFYTDPDLSTVQYYEYSDNPSSASATGIFMKKGIELKLLNKETSQNSVDWIEIRFAEVLLNYAEAANETGKTQEAIDALKSLRKRAGIEEGNGNYGVTATSQNEVRDAIYRERFIEFIFEGQRFWDLKRARKLIDLNGKRERGISAKLKSAFKPITDEKKKTYGYLPENFEYTVGSILKSTTANGTFSISDNYYFAPIPASQIQKNPKLIQNKNWGDGTFNPTLE